MKGEKIIDFIHEESKTIFFRVTTQKKGHFEYFQAKGKPNALKNKVRKSEHDYKFALNLAKNYNCNITIPET